MRMSRQVRARAAAMVSAAVAPGLVAILVGVGPAWPLTLAAVVAVGVAGAVIDALWPWDQSSERKPQQPDQGLDPVTPPVQDWYASSPARDTGPQPTHECSDVPLMAPLASYLSKAQGRRAPSRHPQCPQCGCHSVTVRSAGDAHAFECQRCSHSWAWMAGTAWPRTLPGQLPRD